MKLKNATDSINIRLDHTEERICEVGDKSFEITSKEQREKNKEDKESLHELWVILKRNIYCVIGVPEEGREGERGSRHV